MATGSGTVTNESAGVLNETTLSSVRSNLVTKASEVKNSLVKTTLATSLGSQSLGSGTFYVPGNLEISGTVTGSGTLVVEGSKLTVKHGAKLDWNGTIIVIGDVESPNTQNAEVMLESGGKLDMDHTGSQSFLFIVGQDTKLTAEPGAGSARDITGGLLLLSGPNEDAKLEFKSGGGSDGLVVNGITALYGSKLSATMDNGFNASLTGSLAFVTQAAGSGRYTELTKANGGTVNLTFNSTVFNDSLEALGDYITDTSAFPPGAGSYWERNAQAVLTTQNTRLSSGTKWGVND